MWKCLRNAETAIYFLYYFFSWNIWVDQMVPIFSKITVISLSYISIYSTVSDSCMHVDLKSGTKYCYVANWWPQQKLLYFMRERKRFLENEPRHKSWKGRGSRLDFVCFALRAIILKIFLVEETRNHSFVVSEALSCTNHIIFHFTSFNLFKAAMTTTDLKHSFLLSSIVFICLQSICPMKIIEISQHLFWF